MRRRPAVLLTATCLAASLALGACGSDGKDQAPTTTSTSTTPASGRNGGGGKDNSNSGQGNVGGDSNGPQPGANNSGG